LGAGVTGGDNELFTQIMLLFWVVKALSNSNKKKSVSQQNGDSNYSHPSINNITSSAFAASLHIMLGGWTRHAPLTPRRSYVFTGKDHHTSQLLANSNSGL